MTTDGRSPASQGRAAAASAAEPKVSSKASIPNAVLVLESVGYIVTRWEPVKTIPRGAGPLLVWDGFYECCRIVQTNNAGEAFEGDCGYQVEAATHWMPLPTAPKSQRPSDNREGRE